MTTDPANSASPDHLHAPHAPLALHSTVAADLLYFAVLPGHGFTRAGPVPLGLMIDLAEQVPVDPDSLHAVCAPRGDGFLVACAIPRDCLQELLGSAAAPQAPLSSLTPAALPSSVAGGGGSLPDAASLNFLVGEYEPRAVRAARVRWQFALVAALLAVSGLVTVGLARRAAHAREESAAAMGIASELTRAAVGSEVPLALDHALAQARAGSPLLSRAPTDAAQGLEQILRAWPADVAATPLSISMDQEGAHIDVTVEGDASAFLAAMQPPPGWTREEPRLSTSGSVTRLGLTLRPPSPLADSRGKAGLP